MAPSRIFHKVPVQGSRAQRALKNYLLSCFMFKQTFYFVVVVTHVY